MEARKKAAELQLDEAPAPYRKLGGRDTIPTFETKQKITFMHHSEKYVIRRIIFPAIYSYLNFQSRHLVL